MIESLVLLLLGLIGMYAGLRLSTSVRCDCEACRQFRAGRHR